MAKGLDNMLEFREIWMGKKEESEVKDIETSSKKGTR